MNNWLESRFVQELDTIAFRAPGDLVPVVSSDLPTFEIGTWKTARAVVIDWRQIDSAVEAVLGRCRVQSPKV